MNYRAETGIFLIDLKITIVYQWLKFSNYATTP